RPGKGCGNADFRDACGAESRAASAIFIHNPKQQEAIPPREVFRAKSRRRKPCCCCECCESVERLWRGPYRLQSGKGVREDAVWEARKIRGGSGMAFPLPKSFHTASAAISMEIHKGLQQAAPRDRDSDDRIDSSWRPQAGFEKQTVATLARTARPRGRSRVYCSASIRRVMVRLSSLSERRISSILLMECSTVVWCLPPNCRPISGSEAVVSCLTMYIATWRGKAIARVLLRSLSFCSSRLKCSLTRFWIRSMVTRFSCVAMTLRSTCCAVARETAAPVSEA